MGSEPPSQIEEQPQPFDAKHLEAARKRKRSPSAASNSTPKHQRSRSPHSHSPNKLHSTAPSDPPQISSRDRDSSPPRRKRPTGRVRMSDSEREAIRQRHLAREAELNALTAPRGIHDAVRQHYNAVPERGRDWRKTDSRIKGLRSFNNWIKSTIIQKFSPSEDYRPGAQEMGGSLYPGGPSAAQTKGLLVLDMGCGKGGDLGKWQQAPQKVDLYVGLDPADISIDQARERYRQMAGRGGGGGRGGYHNHGRPPPRLFEGHFYVQDCFGESIEKLPLIRDVGFDSSGGPSRFGGGGFDVVSMMFCMHYAFESEEKARTMLKNVSGALKKGGKFIGCIPNSDVLSERVVEFNNKMASQEKDSKGTSTTDNPSDNTTNGGISQDAEADETEEGELSDTASFSNPLYSIRFPGPTPTDGVFRPPFAWKYSFFLHEAVEEVPEYVVPWEAFRALAEDYNLELTYRKPFPDIWRSEKDDPVLGPLSERMGVRDRRTGEFVVTDEELEVAGLYVAFAFYKV